MEEANLWGMSSNELLVAWREARADGDADLTDKILLNMGDACVEEREMYVNDVGYTGDTSGAGRGKHLKVDIALCRVVGLKEEYAGFAKQKTKLDNQKAQNKINEEDWRTEMDKLLKRREVVMNLIESDVRARVFDETGLTLEQEHKRRKTDNAKLMTIKKLTAEVLQSGKEGERQVAAAKVLHNAMAASSSDMFGEEATKTTQDLKKQENKVKREAAAAKRQQKLAEEEAADPEAFAQKQMDAFARKQAAQAAEAAKKAADPKTIANKEKQQKAANEAAEKAAMKAADALEKARDPVAYAAKKKAEKVAADKAAAENAAVEEALQEAEAGAQADAEQKPAVEEELDQPEFKVGDKVTCNAMDGPVVGEIIEFFQTERGLPAVTVKLENDIEPQRFLVREIEKVASSN